MADSGKHDEGIGQHSAGRRGSASSGLVVTIPWLSAFVPSFVLYALSSSPAMGWLDSPEFVAQAATLGIAHSPGHPIPALLGRLAGLMPVGDLVWRVNLMSALCAAGAVAFLALSMERVLYREVPRVDGRLRAVLALSLSLVAAASWALWSNAVRAEVYALQSLLGVFALYALLRYQESLHVRWILACAFSLALGLANHHLLALTMLLPALVFVLRRPSRHRIGIYGMCAAIGMLGLCALLYLPVRSLTHPEVNFGAPHTFGRFLWTLSGAAFRKSANFHHASSPLLDSLQVGVALGQALTVPLLFLAFYGAWTSRLSRASRGVSRLLVGIVVLCCGVRILLGFDPETPDHHAYLLPAIFALYLLATAGIGHLIALALRAKRPLPKAPALAALALTCLVPVQVGLHWHTSNLREAWASDDMAHWEFRTLPPRTLALLAYFQSRFRTWAMHSVEGARPDVTILDRSFLSYPGMREEALQRHPELAALLNAPLQAGVASPIGLLQDIASKRPLRVQLHTNVDAPLAALLRPHGAWALLATSGGRHEDTRQRARLAKLLGKAAPAEAEAARGALLWHDATRIDQLCILGEKTWAQEVLNDALQLAPSDDALADMARRCDLKIRN